MSLSSPPPTSLKHPNKGDEYLFLLLYLIFKTSKHPLPSPVLTPPPPYHSVIPFQTSKHTIKLKASFHSLDGKGGFLCTINWNTNKWNTMYSGLWLVT